MEHIDTRGVFECLSWVWKWKILWLFSIHFCGLWQRHGTWGECKKNRKKTLIAFVIRDRIEFIVLIVIKCKEGERKDESTDRATRLNLRLHFSANTIKWLKALSPRQVVVVRWCLFNVRRSTLLHAQWTIRYTDWLNEWIGGGGVASLASSWQSK